MPAFRPQNRWMSRTSLGADRQKRLKSGSIGISAGSISRIGKRLCAFGGQYRLKRELHSDGFGGCKTLNKYDANSFLQVRSSSAILILWAGVTVSYCTRNPF